MQTMKIFLFLAISFGELASTTTASKQGLLQPGWFLDPSPNTELAEDGLPAAHPSPTTELAEDSLLQAHTAAAAEPDPKNGTDTRTYIKVTNVSKLWPKQSSVPVFFQYVFAFTWILMMSSLPFILPWLDEQEVTLTQKYVGVALLLVLFGGLYLFTNIILFQSVHFDSERPLTIVQCVYLMSQVITTVGYGDITPAYPRGQVFVALYVLGALFVIAMLVSQAIEHATLVLHKQRQRMLGFSPRVDEEEAKPTTVHDLLEPERPSMAPFLLSIVCFAIIDVIWVAFFCLWPGEKKTFFEAFYMSLITLTTVGFGAITPLTEGGMIFAAFFMLVGSAAVVNMITKFCEFIAMMNEFQRFSPEVKKGAVDTLMGITKSKEKVTEMEFFKFIVKFDNMVQPETIDSILEVFEGLKPQNGVVDMDKVVKAMDIERSRSKYFDKVLTGGVGNI